MTLVIGRVQQGQVFLLGDSQLSITKPRQGTEEFPNPFIAGYLKQYVLTDTLALAFAGNVDHFELAASDLRACTSLADAIRVSQNAQERGLDFEVVLADGEQKSLVSVKESVVQKSPATWIGDAKAFNFFQQHFYTNTLDDTPVGRAHIRVLRLPQPVTDEQLYDRLYSTFRRIVFDSTIPAVGGLIVPLCTHQGNFEYMSYVDVVSDVYEWADLKSDVVTIEFGTAAGGGYSVELTTGEGKGRDSNLGYYFLQGGFGVVFPEGPNGLRKAKLLRASNPAEWVLKTEDELGQPLKSMYMTGDHCGLLGEQYLKVSDYSTAVRCYALGKDDKQLLRHPSKRDRYFAGYATALFNAGARDEAISMLLAEVARKPGTTHCFDQLKQMLKLKT
jgi:hypothetical protein